MPKVVHVGGETPAALRARLVQAGVRLNPLAEQLFTDTRFTVPTPPGAIAVASEPPPDAPDLPWGFYLRRIDGVPWLRGYRCWSGHVWAADDVLVFQQMPVAGSPGWSPISPTPS